jgi:hypothetical protein
MDAVEAQIRSGRKVTAAGAQAGGKP